MTYEWKVPENLHSVAWRMSGKFQRTYREACPSSASSHERYYIPHTTPPVHTCTYRQPQRSMSFLRKFTWRYYMPHPTPPVHTCTYRQPQTSMSFLRKFTWTLLHAPPHPTPPPDVYKTPRPSKGRGPTKCYLFFEMFKSEKQATIKTCDLNNTNEHLSLQIKVLSATNYHISWADFRGKPRVWADHLAALYSQTVPRLIFDLRLPKASYKIWHNTKIHQLQRNSSTAEQAPPKTFRPMVRLSSWLHGPAEDLSSPMSVGLTVSRGRGNCRFCAHHI